MEAGRVAFAGAGSATAAGLVGAADQGIRTTAEMVAASCLSSSTLISRFGNAIGFLRSFK
jgi:hypothetical protein